jgi:hypothetical protein
LFFCQGNRKLVFIEAPARLNDFIEPDQQRLPGATLSLDEDLKVFNGAHKLSPKDTKVYIKVSCENGIGALGMMMYVLFICINKNS